MAQFMRSRDALQWQPAAFADNCNRAQMLAIRITGRHGRCHKEKGSLREYITTAT